MVQSEILTQFYKEYLAWATGYDPRNNLAMSADCALCTNLARWLDKQGCSNSLFNLVTLELGEQFVHSGLDDVYPFNRGDCAEFYLEGDRYHLNQKRIQWVRDHINVEQEET